MNVVRQQQMGLPGRTASTGGILPNIPLSQVGSAVFFFCATIAGTGASYPLDHASQWSSFVGARTRLAVSPRVRAAASVDVRTVAEHVENVRSVLNASVSDLADLLDVSRQAIYKWLSLQTSPEDAKLTRLTGLSKIADAFRAGGVKRAGSLFRMRAVAGQSLRDLVKTANFDMAVVQSLIQEAHAIETGYAKSNISRSKALPSEDWMAYESIPGSSDVDDT
jgi:hypothetical protein